MYEISKTFTFSSAHSVHSQKLNEKWAKSTYPKCRRLLGHGHNYKLTVFISSPTLDEAQMVTDFGHLWWIKSFIDDFVDHKLIMGTDDPAFELLLAKLGLLKENQFVLPEGIKSSSLAFIDQDWKLKVVPFKKLEIEKLKNFNYFTFTQTEREREDLTSDFYYRLLEGIAFMNASPTSENLAKLFYHFVKENIKPLKVKCTKVIVEETDTSKCIYTGDEG